MSIPLGLIVSWMAREELIEGRKWFKVLVIFFIISGIWFYLTGKNHVSLASFFISIFSLVSYIKSFNAKWTKSEKF